MKQWVVLTVLAAAVIRALCLWCSLLQLLLSAWPSHRQLAWPCQDPCRCRKQTGAGRGSQHLMTLESSYRCVRSCGLYIQCLTTAFIVIIVIAIVTSYTWV